MQLTTLSFSDPQYPELLREIRNPPKTIYLRGHLPESGRATVAIVGSRHPNRYGAYVTELYAHALARAGVVIVSGLAFGIDAIAHRAALDAGGTTIAVLGSGVDLITPRSHQPLADEILARGGAVVSEQEPGTQAYASHIVARNRIVAGLSHITLITQAGRNSGTLHTAHSALKDNRSIYAVPSRIDDEAAIGSNDLLRTTTAHPTTSPHDLLDELAPLLTAAPSAHSQLSAPASSECERNVLQLITAGVTSIEELITQSGITVGTLAETITLLELAGQITNLGAGKWTLKRPKLPPRPSI